MTVMTARFLWRPKYNQNLRRNLMEKPPQWAGRQDYKGSGSSNMRGTDSDVRTSTEMQSRSKSRGWRDGSAVKALADPPRMWVPFPTPI